MRLIKSFSSLTPCGKSKSYETCFRFMIPSITDELNLKLKNTYHKYLYLDMDMDMLIIGDIRGLFNADLSIKVCAVVKDYRLPLIWHFKKYLMDESFMKFYFNVGIMMLNLKEFRKINLQDLENFHRGGYYDQDFLNYKCGKTHFLARYTTKCG